MNLCRRLVPFAIVVAAAADAGAQTPQAPPSPGTFVFSAPPTGITVLEAAPLEVLSTVKDAPFSAQAVTEFTQVLGDGNRIERRYVSSIARDSRGRTRREEEIALIGPLGATGPAPQLVTIVDPEQGVTYTLDDTTRVAYRNAAVAGRAAELIQQIEAGGVVMAARPAAQAGRGAGMPAGATAAFIGQPAVEAGSVRSEKLGTRTIEGVRAEGTRTTSTIPAGAIGNLLPIEVTSERWFSPELQLAVLITRRDPRAGETVYRLTNIVRGEQPEALFTLPADYDVRDGALAGTFRRLEMIRPR